MARLSPFRSTLEWLGAAAILLVVVWVAVFLLRGWIEPGPSAVGEVESRDPAGIPDGATAVPLLVLLDGTEIKVGDAHARLLDVLSEGQAIGPSQTIHGDFGERWIRAYRHGATRFFVVCERSDPAEALKVAAIYLP